MFVCLRPAAALILWMDLVWTMPKATTQSSLMCWRWHLRSLLWVRFKWYYTDSICTTYKTDQMLPERPKHIIRQLIWQSFHIFSGKGVGCWLSNKVPSKRVLIAQRNYKLLFCFLCGLEGQSTTTIYKPKQHFTKHLSQSEAVTTIAQRQCLR